MFRPILQTLDEILNNIQCNLHDLYYDYLKEFISVYLLT